ALAELSEIDLDRTALARLAQRAENEFVGVPCGVLDQMASLLCVPGHALLLDTRSLDMRQVPFDLESAGLALLVVDTRVSHDLGDSGYADRRRACERAAAALGVAALRDVEPDDLGEALGRLAEPELVRRVRHVVTEDARVLDAARLLDEGRVAEIGPVLNAAHASIRDDFESSCAELDAAVEATLGAGALGARMIGGGFGGSAIALVGADATASTARAVEARFAAAGWRAPLCFVAAPVGR
ncbi:MAG: galactokinase, partial [Acidimicrobiales bacterium]